MADSPRVLAMAPQAQDRQLAAAFVFASGASGGARVDLLEPWTGSAKTSLPRQLFALREVLINLIDRHRPTTVAVRRPDGGRGGPTLAYDEKVSFTAISGLVAVERSLRYADYRGNQLEFKPTDGAVEMHCPKDARGRRDALTLAAIATALTALRGTSPDIA